jgi:uncharacterized repeat protein (TIGR03803 family)
VLIGKRTRAGAFHIACIAAFVILPIGGVTAQTPGFATIYSFNGPDGDQPEANLILGKDGSLYGTTIRGGAYANAGTIFQLSPGGASWTETMLYSFDSNNGGFNGPGTLVFDTGGSLYATAGAGGKGRGGGVLQLTPPAISGGTWTAAKIYSFDRFGPSGQSGPSGPLVYFPDGTLYGTILTIENVGSGLFVLIPPTAPGGHWEEKILFDFPIGAAFSGVISRGGSLYAVTAIGNATTETGCGAVYEILPPAALGGSWTGTAIHNFAGAPSDGCNSYAALVADAKGNLYGTTEYGGSGSECALQQPEAPGCGTVFQLQPPATPGGYWTETIVYNFTGIHGDGAFPSASLVLGPNGTLYGATQIGGVACPGLGTAGCGTVFQLTPPAASGGAWAENVVHRFTGQNGEGAEPVAGLTLSAAGVLYGTTLVGGTAGLGTVFMVRQ